MRAEHWAVSPACEFNQIQIRRGDSGKVAGAGRRELHLPVKVISDTQTRGHLARAEFPHVAAIQPRTCKVMYEGRSLSAAAP